MYSLHAQGGWVWKSAAHREWGRLKEKVEPLLTLGNSGYRGAEGLLEPLGHDEGDFEYSGSFITLQRRRGDLLLTISKYKVRFLKHPNSKALGKSIEVLVRTGASTAYWSHFILMKRIRCLRTYIKHIGSKVDLQKSTPPTQIRQLILDCD